MNTIDISIISNRGPITLSAEDILYITLDDRKAVIHVTGNKVYETYSTIAELAQTLGSAFILIDRGCLVSAKAIHDVSKTVNLINGEALDYAHRRKREIIEQLHIQREQIKPCAENEEEENMTHIENGHLGNKVIDTSRQKRSGRRNNIQQDKTKPNKIVEGLEILQARQNRHIDVQSQKHSQIPKMIGTAYPMYRHFRKGEQWLAADCKSKLIKGDIERRPKGVNFCDISKLFIEIKGVLRAQEQCTGDHQEYKQTGTNKRIDIIHQFADGLNSHIGIDCGNVQKHNHKGRKDF